MFLLFEMANENQVLEFIPESLEVLIFGIGLVLFAAGLRWLMNRSQTEAGGEFPARESE